MKDLSKTVFASMEAATAALAKFGKPGFDVYLVSPTADIEPTHYVIAKSQEIAVADAARADGWVAKKRGDARRKPLPPVSEARIAELADVMNKMDHGQFHAMLDALAKLTGNKRGKQ